MFGHERPHDQTTGLADPAADLPPGCHRYMLHEKLFALGSNFWIENEQGEQVFNVDAELLHIRDTLSFVDRNGSELCRVQQKLLEVPPAMEIFAPDGTRIALVQKAWISFLHERYVVKFDGGAEFDIQGDFTNHEYAITAGQLPIAHISRKWFRPTDTFGVEVESSQNDVLILAVTVAVDQLSAEQHQ